MFVFPLHFSFFPCSLCFLIYVQSDFPAFRFPALDRVRTCVCENLKSGQSSRKTEQKRQKPAIFQKKNIENLQKGRIFLTKNQTKMATNITKVKFNRKKYLLCLQKAFPQRICKFFLLGKCRLDLQWGAVRYCCFLLYRHKVGGKA